MKPRRDLRHQLDQAMEKFDPERVEISSKFLE